MVISSKKVRSSDFENIEQYTKNKGFIEWVNSISEFISDDDVLLKKLQDDLLLPVTRQVESVRSELNKGRVNEYYQNQRSVVVDVLRSDISDKDFNLIVEYLWEIVDGILGDRYVDYFDIGQKYRDLIDKKMSGSFEEIIEEVTVDFILGYRGNVFSPIKYLIDFDTTGSIAEGVEANPFDLRSYIIFDKKQNKFLFNRPNTTIFGQNLPSTLVLSEPIKQKDNIDSIRKKLEDGDIELPRDKYDEVAVNKEMVSDHIKKALEYFNSYLESKRTFKSGQLPVLTQNNLSFWSVLFNSDDYANYRKQYFIVCFNLIFERISPVEFLKTLVPLIRNSVSSYSVATLDDKWKKDRSISKDLPYGMFSDKSKGNQYECSEQAYYLAC